MDDTVGGFLKQVPVGLLLAPLVFGGLYAALMVIIFRRAAERRRRRAAGEEPAQEKRKNNGGNFFTGRLPDKPHEPAEWSVPAALRALPEPDLEMLATPALMTEPETVESAMITPSMDWLAMMAPVPEETTMPVPAAKLPAPEPDRSQKFYEPSDAVEVMRVWRDLSDGSLIIQMGEQRYRSTNEITNPDLARRFVAVVRELWAMVNNGAPARGSAALSAPEMPGIVPPPEGSAGGMKARIGLLNQPPAEEEQPKPKNVLRQMARQALGQNLNPPPEPRRDGIADAVEEYLQFKLSHTPQFQTRSIHVRPSVDGGVRIEVDNHFYDGVGDVIDADVREFLFTVLREWEARQ